MFNFIGVRHVGWGVKDLATMTAFYRDMLGMTITTELPADSHMGATAFLARHPDDHEHHDLVFFSNPAFAHTAFEVASLGELLTSYREVKEKGVPIDATFNHGFWVSFYIVDPESHRLEFFWRTGVWVPNDYQVMPINLDRPENEVMHDVELLREHFAGGTRTSAAEWNAAHGWRVGQQNPGQWGQSNPGGWNPGQQWGQSNRGGWNPGQQNAGSWNQKQWNANQQDANQWGGGDWNKRVIEEFRASGGKVGSVPTPLLLLTTTGRKSGKPSTVPVGYQTDADRFIVVASSAQADWYLNLVAHPQVNVEVGKESFTASATLVEGEQKEYFLQKARKMLEAVAQSPDQVPNDGSVVALQPVG